ncbi:MAG: UDP-N-acetylmuramoyl-tripeptide--D-alanyl-D-alanine ligase [Planctomycetota bacterium]
MINWSVDKLAEVIIAKRTGGSAGRFSGVSTDSRTIGEGECFFAIKGPNFDGHDYVDQAFAKGASCAVVQASIKGADGRCVLRVGDTVKALGRLAAAYRREMGFRVAAITGSAGKTTTREMIYHVLSRHISCHQAQGSFNNSIGLPLTLLGAGEQHEAVIVELGSSRLGEIEYLSRIAQPDIAVITNVYPAHLEGFGNMRAVAKEKASIAKGLRQGGVLIVNAKFEQQVRKFIDDEIEIEIFGNFGGCDIVADEMAAEGSGGRFRIGGCTVVVNVAGRGNLENALAAWGVCRYFGMTEEQLCDGIKDFEGVNMRLRVRRLGDVTVLDDCYNANPASMANALDCLAEIGRAEGGRMVFICGPMLELGQQAEAFHEEMGRQIARKGVDVLITAGKLAELAARAARVNAVKNLEVYCMEDTEEVCKRIEEFIKPADIILVKASRNARFERVVQTISNWVDVRAALR